MLKLTSRPSQLLAKNTPLAAAAPSATASAKFSPAFSALLLASPGEMIESAATSAKTPQDGSQTGLHGVLRDLMLARQFLVKNKYGIFECMHSVRLFRSEVLGAMQMFFSQPHKPVHFLVYFSGHGSKRTGNWIFTDGEISLHDIYDTFDKFATPESVLTVVADCCHSGAWVEQAVACPDDYDPTRFAIQAACLKDEVCWDTKVGGFFTKSWVSGAYHKRAKQKVWSHMGNAYVEDVNRSFRDSLSSWLPWGVSGDSNAPKGQGLLSSLMAASSLYTCSKECSQLLGDTDLESAQHPIASAPYAFNLVLYDHAQFDTMTDRERFPSPESIGEDLTKLEISHQPTYIDLRDFWLGKH